ncbi:hypothetical protein CDCA_CDCA03G1120 [Cyanidium caldarium]|uniref:Major facilitator superfamily (MFS) profile domain-containing protein n=1 Tax=Cyanidium caldarium TaxID=2771 RepID=A0AAV9ISL6_CYACA|nr:hypothetical protein CDCA_CDCA03G1120 [Cyanidium caldarium]
MKGESDGVLRELEPVRLDDVEGVAAEPQWGFSPVTPTTPDTPTNLKAKEWSGDSSEDRIVKDEKGDVPTEASPKRRCELGGPLANALGSSLGFLVIGYLTGVTSIINVVWDAIYPDGFTSDVNSRVDSATRYGALVGLVLFGLLCDLISRKAGMLLTGLILTIGPILLAGSYGANGSVNGMFWMITVMFGFVGVGIGGEYPAAAVTIMEDSHRINAKTRGRRTGYLTWALRMIGINSSTIVMIILLNITGTHPPSDMGPAWRVALGLPAIPAAVVLMLRWWMREPEVYRDYRAQRRMQVRQMRVTLRSAMENCKWFVRKHGRLFVGLALANFLVEYIDVPLDTYAGTVIHDITGADAKKTAYILLAKLSYIPAAFLASWCLDYFGRKPVLLFGFAGDMIAVLLMGALFPYWDSAPAGYIVLYSAQACLETFAKAAMLVMAAEAFPTGVRALCVGILTGFGYAGGIVGVEVFNPIVNAFSTKADGFRADYLINGGAAALAIVTSFFLTTETRKRVLEEN